jgi:hypothetical protein
LGGVLSARRIASSRRRAISSSLKSFEGVALATFTAPPNAKIRKAGSKPITKRDTNRVIRPFALEVGKISIEWNKMQEYLGLVFGSMFPHHQNIPAASHRDIALAVWHSAASDRAQREMLRAAANAAFKNKLASPPKALDDIEWILNEADRMSGPRNNAIHSAFMLGYSGDELVAQPLWIFGNINAKKLNDKDKSLLPWLILQRKKTETLASFAYAVHYALSHQPTSWPKRPPLPHAESPPGSAAQARPPYNRK